jgi:hypothetical protein
MQTPIKPINSKWKFLKVNKLIKMKTKILKYVFFFLKKNISIFIFFFYRSLVLYHLDHLEFE